MALETKEDIKNRMLRKAAELWGVPANEIKDHADPLVHLILTACAAEIEQLSLEVKESQNHITDRLMQLLTPETVFDVKPAHAIAYADSLAPKITINEEYGLYAKKMNEDILSEAQSKQTFFSPTKETHLIAAKIKYMVTADKAYHFSNHKTKDLFEIYEASTSLSNSTLYLAIETELPEISLDEVSIYFEYQGIAQKELFYYHLKNARWFISDGEIDTINGYRREEESQLKNFTREKRNKTQTLIDNINSYYEKFYTTLKVVAEESERSSFPEIETLLETQKSNIEQGLFWLKIEFPSVISNKMLSSLFCSLNTFPVVNRKKENFSYQMKKFISLVPIISESLFLDVKNVQNIEGESYQQKDLHNEIKEKGTYALKSQNLNALDTLKAKDYLVRLLDLLKNESAAFSFLEHDFLSSNIETLNQTIAVIDEKLSVAPTANTHTNYMSVKPYKDSENIFIEYWTSIGEKANALKAGLSLQVYEGYDINPNTAYMVTPTFGGQDKLSKEQRLNAYRSIALSHNKIVTEKDIEMLCYDLYQDKISKVQVKRGKMTDYARSKGLTICIEIILTPSEVHQVKDYEWDYLNNNLMAILKERSMNVYPFKISIKNNAIKIPE